MWSGCKRGFRSGALLRGSTHLSPFTSRCLVKTTPATPHGLAFPGNLLGSTSERNDPFQVSNADVFIPTTGIVDEKAVRSAPKLKLIVQPAAGHNNIPVETAASLGIPVCTAPGTRLLLNALPSMPCLLLAAKGCMFAMRGDMQ